MCDTVDTKRKKQRGLRVQNVYFVNEMTQIESLNELNHRQSAEGKSSLIRTCDEAELGENFSFDSADTEQTSVLAETYDAIWTSRMQTGGKHSNCEMFSAIRTRKK